MALVTKGKTPPSRFRPVSISMLPLDSGALQREEGLTARLGGNRGTGIAMVGIRQVVEHSQVDCEDSHGSAGNRQRRDNPWYR